MHDVAHRLISFLGLPLLIEVAFHSSSMRYRVKGAIATRCPSFTVPTLNGWNSFDMIAQRGTISGQF
jgi:hypothetical protein